MDAQGFVEALERAGVTFFVGVPDSYLHGFCSALGSDCGSRCNLTAANEGNAVAMAVGRHLASGDVPLVYLQNSGLGNAMNPLASLACKPMLGVPMILLIGWRGDPSHSDHVQHELQGKITPGILESLDVPFIVLEDGADAAETSSWAVSAALEAGSPVAILVPKGVLSGVKSPLEGGAYPLSREQAIGAVLDAAPCDAIFAATTGRASRELWWLREARGESHESDYLNVGSMGHVSSVALGMAVSDPERAVVCLDGDAAVIMHMGSMTMPVVVGTSNLLHVVLNNGVHESVGGQPSAGYAVDLTGVARACGYETAASFVSTREEVGEAVRDLCARDGAGFLEVRISPGIRSDLPPLEIDPARMKRELMERFGLLSSLRASQNRS